MNNAPFPFQRTRKFSLQDSSVSRNARKRPKTHAKLHLVTIPEFQFLELELECYWHANSTHTEAHTYIIHTYINAHTYLCPYTSIHTHTHPCVRLPVHKYHPGGKHPESPVLFFFFYSHFTPYITVRFYVPGDYFFFSTDPHAFLTRSAIDLEKKLSRRWRVVASPVFGDYLYRCCCYYC